MGTHEEWNSLFFSENVKKKLIILFSIICLISYYGYVLLDYSGAIGRWTYFFDKNGVNAIYSSRDIFGKRRKRSGKKEI